MSDEQFGPPKHAVDLGHDTYYTKMVRGDEWVGIYEWHQCSEGGEYGAGAILFTPTDKSERQPQVSWEVTSYEPLTLSPSLQCRMCGHHGWIRNGRWESC